MGALATKWILSYDKNVFARGSFPANPAEHAKFSRALHVFKRIGFCTDEHTYCLSTNPAQNSRPRSKEYWKTIDLLPCSSHQPPGIGVLIGIFNSQQFDDMSLFEEKFLIAYSASTLSGRPLLHDLFTGVHKLLDSAQHISGKFPVQGWVGSMRFFSLLHRDIIQYENQIKEIIARNELLLK